jgi:tetratricopeptide (TPR) repeat protein
MDVRFTGVGLGLRSAADLYQRRYLPIDPGFNHAHNMFLQSYLEQGLLGLLGLLLLTLLALQIGSRALRQARDPSTRMVAISGSAAALVLLLEGLTEIVPLTTVGMVLLLGAFALVLAAERLATRPLAEQPPRPVAAPSRRLAAPVGVAALAVLFLVGTSIPGLAQAAQSTGQANEPTGPFHALAAQVTLNLGSIELMQGTFDENRRRVSRGEHQRSAEYWFRRTLELDPGNWSAYRGLADLAVARDEPGEARRLLSDARRRVSPNDSRFQFQLGRLYKETGSVDLAIAAWIRTDPSLGAWSCSSPDLQLVRWGRELTAQERYESAAKTYRAAIEIRPTDPLPYQLLVGAMLADEDENVQRGLFTARETMQALAKELPDVPWAYHEVAQLYARAGRAYSAWDWRGKAAEVEDSSAWGALQQRHQRVRSCDDFLLPQPA